MNGVLWLQKWSGVKSADRKSARTSYRKNAEAGSELLHQVFIELPKRPPGLLFRKVAPNFSTPHVAVVFPQHYDPNNKSKRNGKGLLTGKRKFSQRLLSVFTLIASVFAAIGMLHMMISGLRMQVNGYSYMRPGQAVHKPGPGPALQDAVANEYQHALTRDMIAASDTGSSTEVKGKKSKKSETTILPQIHVTTNKFSTANNSIHNLKLKIFNGSKNTLDKLIIQVDFLAKNGKLLRSVNFSAGKIASLQEKTIDVLEDMPGVQVRYYIQEVRTKALRTSLRAL